ncbi:MAG: hypothetical protein LH650_00010 [Chloroflexi bacterium]|nr:hypothetical protein [Chloroflexota bacterium]
MAAIRPSHKDMTVGIGPWLRQRLVWLFAALVSGWMAATIVAVLVVFTGMAPGVPVTVMIVAGTAIAATILYERFRRLGHIDEPLVLCLLIGWAMLLGLLSL